jgi:light-regulated signal transduction histidine kinase (bacteriophytochrome)
MLFPPDHLDEETEILSRIRRGERIHHYETIRRRKDGSLLDISLTVSPIKDANGNVVGASKIARDVTERKRSEAELRRVNADLEQFAYSASHDLKEPIRNVAIYAEILERRCGHLLNAKGSECVSVIRDSALRMNTLVTSLLAYVQSGGDAELMQEIDAAAALRSAMANLSSTMAETQAIVTYDDLPVVRAGPGQIEHVFQNLVGNAIKYRCPGERPRVHVSAQRIRDAWKFAVQDNGIGVPFEYRRKIFSLFSRLHADPQYAGNGIGLAICQRIIERHGGSIWVESEGENKGSTFCFTLPVTHGWS